jgi:hypothetical protein
LHANFPLKQWLFSWNAFLWLPGYLIQNDLHKKDFIPQLFVHAMTNSFSRVFLCNDQLLPTISLDPVEWHCAIKILLIVERCFFDVM